MNRNDSIIKLNKVLEWDIVIIGGGASGLGIAVDASKRGYKTLLLEKLNFNLFFLVKDFSFIFLFLESISRKLSDNDNN